MSHEITQETLFQALSKSFRSEHITQDDLNSFLKTVNAPDKLTGIWLVSVRILSLSDLLQPPVICDEDIPWRNKIFLIAKVIEEHQIFLRKKFGDDLIKKPSGTAMAYPLYYLLFHQHKPGMEQEFNFLLAWIFIAFHKYHKTNIKGKKLSQTTAYNACLGLRGLSDERTTGNALETLNLNLSSLGDVSNALKHISRKKEIVRHGTRTKKRLSDIVLLLTPNPKNTASRVHSGHSRGYFLSTPHLGFVPLIARLINRKTNKNEVNYWSPSEVVTSDICDSQLQSYGSDDDCPHETNSRLSTIEIRQPQNSNPELYHYQLISVSNAIARENQSIPFKTNTLSLTDLDIYLNQVHYQNLDSDTSLILILNLYTGISIEKLSTITFLDDRQIQKNAIYLDYDSSRLILPIRTPDRRRQNKNNPTHFPLTLSGCVATLLRHNEIAHHSRFEINEEINSASRNRLFRHRSNFYLGVQKKLTRSINNSKGTHLSVGKLRRFFVDRGQYLGIDPTILSQISQTELSNSKTQAHYTAISVNDIQEAYQAICADMEHTSNHSWGAI